MSLSDRELAMAKAFGQAHRRYERQTSMMIFVVALMCGLFGAYFGMKAVLSLFAAVATAMALNFAIAWIRKSSVNKNA